MGRTPPSVRRSTSSVSGLLASLRSPARTRASGPTWTIGSNHGRIFPATDWARRAANAFNSGRHYWVAAERAQMFSLLFPDASFDRAVVEIESTLPSRDDALLALVTGWMTHLGPATAEQLGSLLGLPSSEIEKALLRMEASRRNPARESLPHQRKARGRAGPAPHDTKSSGVSGDCWREFIDSPWQLCASRLSRYRRRSSCAGCCAGSTSRPERRSRGNERRSKYCGSFRVSRFPPMPGNGKSWRRRIANYDPQVARPTLPDRRGGLGTSVSASGDARRFCCRQAASDSDQRGSHYILCSRRGRLDDSA